jgi:hypothetical protein
MVRTYLGSKGTQRMRMINNAMAPPTKSTALSLNEPTSVKAINAETKGISSTINSNGMPTCLPHALHFIELVETIMIFPMTEIPGCPQWGQVRLFIVSSSCSSDNPGLPKKNE